MAAEPLQQLLGYITSICLEFNAAHPSQQLHIAEARPIFPRARTQVKVVYAKRLLIDGIIREVPVKSDERTRVVTHEIAAHLP